MLSLQLMNTESKSLFTSCVLCDSKQVIIPL